MKMTAAEREQQSRIIEALYAKRKREPIEVNPWPDSVLAKRMCPEARVVKTDRPITRDCYAAHMMNWCGGATPRRRGAE